jgi:hypothetical protein
MSASPTLHLELDDDRLVGDDQLTGRISLPNPSASDVDSVQLEARHVTSIPGSDNHRRVAADKRITTDGSTGERTFELPLPAGPYSFDAGETTLEWQLRATAVDAQDNALTDTTRTFDLVAGDARKRSTDAVGLEDTGGLPDSVLGNLIGSITSAFGQPASLEEVHRSLESIETGTGPYEREHSLTGNLALIVITLAVGLGAVIAGPSLVAGTHAAVPWVIRAIGLIFVGVGSWVLYTSLRNRMAESAVGDVDIHVDPDSLVRGDAFTCTVAFSPEREVDINHLQATLKCVKTDKTKGRRHDDPFRHHHDHHDTFDEDDDNDHLRTRTYTETLFSEPIELTGSSHIDIGEHRGYGETFTIPKDSPHSYRHTTPFWARLLPIRGLLISRTITWAVEVHLDIDDWPDWKTEYQCRVYP